MRPLFHSFIAGLFALLCLSGQTLYAQGFSGAVVTAPVSILVSGQQMQLRAVSRDGQGNPRNADQFIFRSSNSVVIDVDASGVVTAKNPGVSNITAIVQGINNYTTPVIQLQVIPLRIDVTSASPSILVGSSLQFTATAVDVNEQPIPGVAFRWQVSGANGGNTRGAAIDNNGLLTASGIGLMTVHAQIVYSGQTSDQLPMFEGLAQVDIEAKKEYQLHRLLTNTPLQPPLALRPAYNSDPAINDSGQIAFTANLDGLGIALMFYDNGQLQLVNTAGIPGPQGGYIWEFEGPPAINNRGEVLVRVGTSNGWGLMRASKYTGFTYFMENGTAEGFNRMSFFRIGRYSFNDQGDMLLLADFQFIGDTVWHTGLFILNDQGLRYIVTNTDQLPAFPAGFTFDNSFFGVDRNGIAYFRVMSPGNSAIFRADGSSDPVKIVGTGTAAGGIQVQDVINLTMSPGGNLAFSVNATNGQVGVVRLRSGQKNLEYLPLRTIGQVLSINDSGDTLYSGDPGQDPWWGMYVWQSTATQVLRFGVDTLEGGEKPGWSNVGKITATGQIYASLDSPQNHLLAARLDGTRHTLWKGGMVLNQTINLNFQGLVPGAQSGSAHTFGGGSNASILEVLPTGPRAIWTPGDNAAAGLNSINFTYASKNPSGDIYLAFWDGITRLSNGKTETLLHFPFSDFVGGAFGAVIVRGPSGWYDGNNAFAANSSGVFVFNARTDRENRLELSNHGTPTGIMIQGGPSQTASPSGGKFSGIAGTFMRQNSIVIDERGRVLVNAQVTGGPSGLFLYDNGQWMPAALFRQTTINGETVQGCRSIRVAGQVFYALLDMTNGDTMIARYDGQSWTRLAGRDDVVPDGTAITSFYNSFAVSRYGEIVYAVNANGEKVVFLSADGTNHLVYSEMALTDDGDRLPNQNFEFDLRDGGLIYLSGFDSTDRSTVYKAEMIH